ncbi:MAG: hypothetical protein M0Z99_17570 [Betaproteobacteria bacterium]|nr:hypothetical protein [Betaproteobacteria bacterium]
MNGFREAAVWLSRLHSAPDSTACWQVDRRQGAIAFGNDAGRLGMRLLCGIAKHGIGMESAMIPAKDIFAKPKERMFHG